MLNENKTKNELLNELEVKLKKYLHPLNVEWDHTGENFIVIASTGEVHAHFLIGQGIIFTLDDSELEFKKLCEEYKKKIHYSLQKKIVEDWLHDENIFHDPNTNKNFKQTISVDNELILIHPREFYKVLRNEYY